MRCIRKRWRFMFLALGFCALAVISLLVFWPTGNVDPAHYDAIRIAMARRDVEAIFERSPDIIRKNQKGDTIGVWTSLVCGEAIAVVFDRNDNVEQKQFATADHLGIRIALLIKRFEQRLGH